LCGGVTALTSVRSLVCWRSSNTAEQPSEEQEAVPERKASSSFDIPTGADEVKAQHISELMIDAGKHLRAKEYQEAKQVRHTHHDIETVIPRWQLLGV